LQHEQGVGPEETPDEALPHHMVVFNEYSINEIKTYPIGELRSPAKISILPSLDELFNSIKSLIFAKTSVSIWTGNHWFTLVVTCLITV